MWWAWIVAACVVAYLTKLVGYLLPAGVVRDRRVMGVTGAMTIGLLAALVATNSVTRGTDWVLDSRLLAVAVAVLALRWKTPFLLVVLLGAATVALGRMAGLA